MMKTKNFDDYLIERLGRGRIEALEEEVLSDFYKEQFKKIIDAKFEYKPTLKEIQAEEILLESLVDSLFIPSA